ncbi:MAG: DUF3644 domain-containing protein [Flavobacteriales bacterium]
MAKTRKPRTQSVTKQQRATLAFLQEQEGLNRAFMVEEFSLASGYGIENASLPAKLNRGEFGDFIVRQADGWYKAHGTIGLSEQDYARRVSTKNRVGTGMPDTLSGKLAEKSIQAALSAIEVYNKPDFKYREESFAILIVNAWELLLKARVAFDNSDTIESLYVLVKDKQTGAMVPKRSRSGNPLTLSIGDAMERVVLDGVLKQHLFALTEIRDNAIHLMNDSPMIKAKVQEVGTASLRNYLQVGKDWFNADLSKYNFYIMPMSFFHAHEVKSYSISSEAEQHQNLLRYIANIETGHELDKDSPFAIALELKTAFVKSSLKLDPDNPNAISIRTDPEDVYKTTFIWNYVEQLRPKLKERYIDLKFDPKFYALKKKFEKDKRLAQWRLLDPNKPNGSGKWFYSPNILKEFNKHYTPKTK